MKLYLQLPLKRGGELCKSKEREETQCETFSRDSSIAPLMEEMSFLFTFVIAFFCPFFQLLYFLYNGNGRDCLDIIIIDLTLLICTLCYCFVLVFIITLCGNLVFCVSAQ